MIESTDVKTNSFSHKIIPGLLLLRIIDKGFEQKAGQQT